MTSKETVHIIAHKKVVEFMQEYFVSNPDQKSIHSSLIAKQMGWEPSQLWYALTCIQEMGSINRVGKTKQSQYWELTYKLRVTRKAIRARDEEKRILKVIQNTTLINQITEDRLSLTTEIV